MITKKTFPSWQHAKLWAKKLHVQPKVVGGEIRGQIITLIFRWQ